MTQIQNDEVSLELYPHDQLDHGSETSPTDKKVGRVVFGDELDPPASGGFGEGLCGLFGGLVGGSIATGIGLAFLLVPAATLWADGNDIIAEEDPLTLQKGEAMYEVGRRFTIGVGALGGAVVVAGTLGACLGGCSK